MSFDQIDYRHYLDQNKLKESDRFQPVFEAVENAFNAIEERLRLEPGSPEGLVTITINRRAEQRTIGDQKSRGQFSPPEIAGFTVVDNGVGFRDENWAAFKTVYTSHKKLHGGKGVGRLSYLQAFTEAEVTSTYPCADGCRRRRFTIQRTASGVSDDQVEELETAACETTLVLRNFEPRYCKKAPKALDAIARSFVVHFFQRFSVSASSQCLIVDDWDDTKLNLNQFCHSEFMLKKLDEPISIGSYPLMITHTKCKTRVADKHQIMLCANGRVVRTVDLPKDALPTKKKLDSGDGGYFYVAFVNGLVLDEHANQDRLGFALEETTGETVFEDDLPSIQQIAEAVGAAGRKFLAADIDPLEEEHRQRVIKYCTDNIAYRPLIKNRMDQLMTISFGLSEREFEKEVWGIYHQWKGEVRRRFGEMAKTVRENTDELREYREGYREILRDVSQVAFHELAEYVTDRKAVIDFLQTRLARGSDGKFKDEDAIHDIFFPRKATSNDIAWDEYNLWLIDERLAFQDFVASDIPLKDIGLDGSVAKTRPDIATLYDKLFDTTFAFSDDALPFTSLTLVEFKKPERSSYNEKENPVAQAIRYIREIREKKAFTRDNRVFRLQPNSPIHVHVICHIVENLLDEIQGYNYCQSTDGEGIWLYMDKLNAMVEIISFEKLIADARKRNEVFFQKLGIDGATPYELHHQSDDAA